MFRNFALAVALSAAASGCGGSGITDQHAGGVGVDSSRKFPPEPVIVKSVSPNFAFALNPEITLTVTGSGFVRRSGMSAAAVWKHDSTTMALATTVVSDTILKVVVPAELLSGEIHEIDFAHLVVQVTPGVSVSDSLVLESNTVLFTVWPRDTAFLAAPASVAAGSPDLTITVMGNGFVDDDLDGVWSSVALSVNGTVNWLATKFVSSSELTAVIPAALLKKPLAGLVFVADASYSDGATWRTGATNFTVNP